LPPAWAAISADKARRVIADAIAVFIVMFFMIDLPLGVR